MKGYAEKSTHDKLKGITGNLGSKLLPHLGTDDSVETKARKAFFIGYMTHRLLNAALGRSGQDDRDHYGKKRLELAGVLMGNLFKDCFKRQRMNAEKELGYAVKRNPNNIIIGTLFVEEIISKQLKGALATGNWPGPNKSKGRNGIAQSLNRLTFASTLSHLRRVNTPLSKSDKLAKPRQLHNTHWGMICPCETPEGAPCGLVKNLTLMAKVSVGSPSSGMLNLLTKTLNLIEEISNTSTIVEVFGKKSEIVINKFSQNEGVFEW
jgi:DNA-directed RNA polymerase II subunit RPB2